MELRPGYKQTEVGVIPEEWFVKPLKGLTTEISDGIHSTPEYVSVSDFYFVNGNNFINDEITVTATTLCVSEAEFKSLKKPLTEQTLLFSINGTIGNLAFYRGEKVVLGKSAAYINVAKGVSKEFISYCLKSKPTALFFENELTGTTIRNLSLQSLRNTPIPCPPTPEEQRAIATALSDVDALIGALDRLIAKKRDLKQAAMQQLFTGQTRLPGFSGEWNAKRVDEFGEVVTGGTPRTEVKMYWGEGYPWITPTDISTHRDMLVSERSLTRNGLNAIRMLPANTVLVTCIASIGKNAILRAVGGCNQQINAVIPNKNNNAEFLYYLFESSKQYLLANAGTTATSIISKVTFVGLTFKVPLLQEQIAIATILSDMDAEIAALEARRDKTSALKQGMMQELLTGRIRLI